MHTDLKVAQCVWSKRSFSCLWSGGDFTNKFLTIVWPCIVTDYLWVKPTDALNYNFIGITTLFYWYYYYTCLGQPFCPSSGVLSRTTALVHYMQLWWPFAARSRMAPAILLLVAYGHHNCIWCTKAVVRLRTPDDGQKGCPKHVESSYQ